MIIFYLFKIEINIVICPSININRNIRKIIFRYKFCNFLHSEMRIMDSSESLAEKTASLISIGEEQFISFSNFNDPILLNF